MRFTLGLLMLALVTGCATGYKRIGDQGTVVGYDETLVKPGQYRVTYQGAQGQSNLEIYSLFLRRASELANQEDAPHFKVVEGTQSNQMVNTMMGLQPMPNYTGTVILLQKPEEGSLDTQETIKLHLKAKNPKPAPTSPKAPTTLKPGSV